MPEPPGNWYGNLFITFSVAVNGGNDCFHLKATNPPKHVKTLKALRIISSYGKL